jgi:O-antigen ligase
MNPAKYPLPLANLLLLLAAAISVMVAGMQDAWAVAVFLAGAGLALFSVRPLVRPSAVPLVLVALFCILCLLAFLPSSYFPVPEWRSALMELGSVSLADSVNPQPWFGWFWWWLLAGTCLAYSALLTAPLQAKPLALVLHSAAFFVAVYAALSIFASQTGWKYPFHGGAVFGFLPNRNHTATLLVVGSVLSFGLMQWRLARGDKLAASFAALCGAPSLAALLFFSTSRAGVVFLVVGLAIWAVGALRSPGMRKRILSAVLVLAVFAGLLFFVGGSTVRDRVVGLWKDAVSVKLDSADKDIDFRQPVFRDAARMISEQPFSGVGLGQFGDVFRQYRDESARAATVLHPESDWLMVAAETGFPSALALAALFFWYVFVCWKSRAVSGGMLRWTAASAIAAAALHGIVDVPWHRPSVGWFLLSIAASSVPSSGYTPRAPVLSRFLFVLGGLTMIVAAGWIGYEKREGREPVPYRWSQISSELQQLGQERRFARAEEVAQQAIRQFPLRSEAYYWLAGYLRMFAGTDNEIDAAVRAGRAVEPVLPAVPAEQAVILQDINPGWAMEAWVEAIKRAAILDEKERRGAHSSAAGYTSRAVAAFKDDPEWQLQLAVELEGQPTLLAYWITAAGPEAVDAKLRDMQSEQQFLDALSPKQRQQVLSRWIALPEAQRAVAFMEEREAVSAKGEYWPVLARYYAAQGDLPRAVRRVASSCGISSDAPRDGDAGLRGEMAALIAQGNTVAARRLANDAVVAPKADTDALAAALSYYASQEDWPSAWKAASRLANEAKIGQ